ncbi:hypothetical protein FACS1894208_04790 [Clostridia bacterium]|nr:hypothetical protein FACS1894208_04790 [Clostridia bacterium]
MAKPDTKKKSRDDDEDIEDDRPSDDKKGKKPKKEKKEKKGKSEEGAEKDEDPGKPKKEKPVKEKKEKKPHPVIKTLFRTSLVWLIVVLAFVVVTYLNLFTMKEIVLQALNPEDSYEVVYASEIEDMQAWETDNENRSAELDEREAALDERETEIDDKQGEVELRLAALGYGWDDDLSNIDEENPQAPLETNDITDVAKFIAAMTPSRAAQSLLNIDSVKAVKILNAMKAANRAPILDAMDPADASALIEMMVAPVDE